MCTSENLSFMTEPMAKRYSNSMCLKNEATTVSNIHQDSNKNPMIAIVECRNKTASRRLEVDDEGSDLLGGVLCVG